MPNILITPVEARVLGSLIEKEITTPEYYPLSLNALTNACNQKSNRDPVMDIDEESVVISLDRLRQRKLVHETHIPGSRVPRYGHRVREVFDFSPHEIGVICVLLLRGPQTLGEIRGRTERLCQFKDLPEVEATITRLMGREDGPFVAKLPRQLGYKECRYAHLFCGEVEVEKAKPVEPAVIAVRADDERINALEKKVEILRAELDELKKRLRA
ncbi:MAG: YceH family protein [Candidatus Aureabacteria bacterium]|nr:YceH family protein [Candidatus Auribacterota bacterium]